MDRSRLKLAPASISPHLEHFLYQVDARDQLILATRARSEVVIATLHIYRFAITTFPLLDTRGRALRLKTADRSPLTHLRQPCSVPFLLTLLLCSLRAPLAPVQLPQDANQGTLYTEADKNLQNHFDSIQIISERTTFPQMLLELVKGLGRIADVGTLIMRLKCVALMPASVCDFSTPCLVCYWLIA